MLFEVKMELKIILFACLIFFTTVRAANNGKNDFHGLVQMKDGAQEIPSKMHIQSLEAKNDLVRAQGRITFQH